MRTIPTSMNAASDIAPASAYHVQSPRHFATQHSVGDARRFNRRLDQAGIAIAFAGFLAIVLPAICMVLAGGTPA